MKIATHKSGKTVEVIAISGGWTTIIIDGEQKKVRNSEISSVTEKAEATPVKAPKERKPIDINTRKNGVVDSVYLPQYVSAKVVLADGTSKRAVDCGDEIATKMRAMTINQVYEFVSDMLKVSDKALRARYETLNTGMQRMNLGNLVRKALRDQAKMQNT